MPNKAFNTYSSSQILTYTSHRTIERYMASMEAILHELSPLQEEDFSTSMLRPTNPSPQGFSSLPRVSEAFTPNKTFNPQETIQEKNQMQVESTCSFTYTNNYNIHHMLTHKSYKNTLIISIFKLS